MVESVPAAVAAAFLLFCRIGTALMLMPGFGSARVPASVRLPMALAATLALAPGLIGGLLPLVRGRPAGDLAALVAGEVAVGLLIGVAGRALLAAFEGMMTAANSVLGIAAQPIGPVEGDEALPPLVTFATLLAVMLVFATDLHLEMLEGLAASYATVPPGASFDGGAGLGWLTGRVADGFLGALKVTAPFLVYGMVANLAIGLVNRTQPTLAVYFIAQPALILGGLWLLAAVLGQAAVVHLDVFRAFLRFG